MSLLHFSQKSSKTQSHYRNKGNSPLPDAVQFAEHLRYTSSHSLVTDPGNVLSVVLKECRPYDVICATSWEECVCEFSFQTFYVFL